MEVTILTEKEKAHAEVVEKCPACGSKEQTAANYPVAYFLICAQCYVDLVGMRSGKYIRFVVRPA